MITLPLSTTVGRNLPKEAFYRRLTLNAELKEKFVGEIRRIILSNSLTGTTLNLQAGGEVTEILLLTVELKKALTDYRVIEAIARQNPHKLVFHLQYGEQEQLALYYGKLYKTPWRPLGCLPLEAKGFTLDGVWDNMVAQIALSDADLPQSQDLTVPERIERQERRERLEKELTKTERLTRVEKQPKKKFELYQRVQELTRELEDI
ncbi:MAG: DUF4391 domain-containing protein [Oscillospiraceae bacterium]